MTINDTIVKGLQIYADMHTDREILSNSIQMCDEWFVDLNKIYRWYWAVGAMIKPESVLELGVRYGYSAVALLRGLLATAGSCDIPYIGVDSECDGIPSNAIAAKNLRWLNPQAAILKYSTADPELNSTIQSVRGRGLPFDLIHIDGDHSEAGIINELAIAKIWSTGNTIILVDDCNTDHINKAVTDFCCESGRMVTYLPTYHRLGLVT